jgi:hypothetical protein
MANSWQPHAKSASPCQWLEEAMVDAFSLRGLGRLAESWKQNPPFPGDNDFGNAIADYRKNVIQKYAKLAALTILAEYERAPDCIEALGALNRWPGRSGVPIEDYLRQWEASCTELKACALLPARPRETACSIIASFYILPSEPRSHPSRLHQ